MIELLKEQVYHSNVVHSMTSPPSTYQQHPLLTELDTTAHDSGIHQRELSAPSTLMEQLSLMQRQMETSQSHTTQSLNDSMKEVGCTLISSLLV